MSEIIDKLFRKDRFDAEFRNALKKQNFSIASQINENTYEVTNGTVTFRLNIGSARKIYEKRHSEKSLLSFVNHIEAECMTESRMVSFTNGQAFLRYIIVRESDLNKNMIYSDFVGSLKKVVVYTPDDENLRYLNKSCLQKWAVPTEVLMSAADRNMCRLLNKAKVNQSELCKGVKALELTLPSGQLSAALIMCNDYRRAVNKYMGKNFLVVAPSCESVLAVGNITQNMLGRLANVVTGEFKRAANPLTTDVLMYTPDKIDIAGSFPVDENKSEAQKETDSVLFN